MLKSILQTFETRLHIPSGPANDTLDNFLTVEQINFARNCQEGQILFAYHCALEGFFYLIGDAQISVDKSNYLSY